MEIGFYYRLIIGWLGYVEIWVSGLSTGQGESADNSSIESKIQMWMINIGDLNFDLSKSFQINNFDSRITHGHQYYEINTVSVGDVAAVGPVLKISS